MLERTLTARKHLENYLPFFSLQRHSLSVTFSSSHCQQSAFPVCKLIDCLRAVVSYLPINFIRRYNKIPFKSGCKFVHYKERNYDCDHGQQGVAPPSKRFCFHFSCAIYTKACQVFIFFTLARVTSVEFAMDFSAGLFVRMAISTVVLCNVLASLKFTLHLIVVKVLQPILT